MTFIIPDPRWEEPSLLIPGRTPIGPVEIDWDHPLIAKYGGRASPTKGGLAVFNLSGLELVSKTYPITGLLSKEVSYPPAVITNSTNAIWGTAHPFASSSSFSFVVELVGKLTATDDALFNCGSFTTTTNNAGFYLRQMADETAQLTVYNNNSTSNVVTVGDNMWGRNKRWWVYGYNDVPNNVLYLQVFDPLFGFRGEASTTSKTMRLTGTWLNRMGNSTSGQAVSFAICFSGARILSQGDAMSLLRNPYQFLIPA